MNKWITLFFTASIVLIAWQLQNHLSDLTQWIRSTGPYSVIVFCICYCCASLLFLPIVPIILAGGAIYGLYWGFLINLFAATLSALMAFMISRYMGIEWLPKRMKTKIKIWINKIDNYGWKSLAICRLMPFIPCAAVNYAFGFTQIRTPLFIFISFIFFMPYKMLETYSGYLSF